MRKENNVEERRRRRNRKIRNRKIRNRRRKKILLLSSIVGILFFVYFLKKVFFETEKVEEETSIEIADKEEINEFQDDKTEDVENIEETQDKSMESTTEEISENTISPEYNTFALADVQGEWIGKKASELICFGMKEDGTAEFYHPLNHNEDYNATYEIDDDILYLTLLDSQNEAIATLEYAMEYVYDEKISRMQLKMLDSDLLEDDSEIKELGLWVEGSYMERVDRFYYNSEEDKYANSCTNIADEDCEMLENRYLTPTTLYEIDGRGMSYKEIYLEAAKHAEDYLNSCYRMPVILDDTGEPIRPYYGKGYTMHDITGDGIPELLYSVRYSKHANEMLIYSYIGEEVKYLGKIDKDCVRGPLKIYDTGFIFEKTYKTTYRLYYYKWNGELLKEEFIFGYGDRDCQFGGEYEVSIGDFFDLNKVVEVDYEYADDDSIYEMYGVSQK